MEMERKTYLRYRLSTSFGVVVSYDGDVNPGKSVAFVSSRYAVVTALEKILVWDVVSGDCIAQFIVVPDSIEDSVAINGDPFGITDEERRRVSCLSVSSQEKYLAGGLSNGDLVMWDFQETIKHAISTSRSIQSMSSSSSGGGAGKYLVKLKRFSARGHKSGVSSVAFHPEEGSLIATGGHDTDIVLWDITSESGLFRLKGHKDEVTNLKFVQSNEPNKKNYQLISSSKDSLMKVWDLESRYCLFTIVSHKESVWSFDINPTGDRIFTGSSDNLLRGFWLSDGDKAKSSSITVDADDKSQVKISLPSIATTSSVIVEPWKLMAAPIIRQSTKRVQTVMYSPEGDLLGVQSADKVIEFYYVRSAEEAKKKMKRRIKRQKEKLKPGEELPEDIKKELEQPTVTDELQLLAILRTNQSVRSFSFGRRLNSKSDVRNVLVSFSNNLLEVHTLKIDKESKLKSDDNGEDIQLKEKQSLVPSIDLKHEVSIPGHRADTRAIALSSDNSLLLSVVDGSMKLWNLKTRQCIRTVECGYALSVVFAPGDVHAIIGMKDGSICVVNLASGAIIRNITDAHQKEVWSLDIRPDMRGLISGSADKDVKFWDFGLDYVTEGENDNNDENDDRSDNEDDSDGHEEDGDKSNKRRKKSGSSKKKKKARNLKKDLQLIHSRTLKMTDDVLCVRYSKHKDSEQLVIAVALLDSTVKIFHDDSLKFRLSLYGHKLPVMAIDISDDGTLCVTGGADKNIRIWGLDFGDCHRSLFAHDAAITNIRFVPNTHYLFTTSKDNKVRYWDADHYEMILSLDKHFSEVSCIAVSNDGGFLITSGKDRSFRIFERTDDVVFLSEERDREFEKNLAQEKIVSSKTSGSAALSAAGIVDENNVAESGPVATLTSTSVVDAGERLIEALELAEELGSTDISKISDNQVLMKLRGKTPFQNVAFVLQSTPSQDLDEIILMLPFSRVPPLMKHLAEMLKRGISVELAAKTAIAILHVHFKQVVASGTSDFKKTMTELREYIHKALQERKDIVGCNLAGLKMLKRDITESSFI